MKVAYITSDWSNIAMEHDEDWANLQHGGANWYRCQLPSTELNNHGHQSFVAENVATTPTGLLVIDRDGIEHDDCDIIVMQRIMDGSGSKIARCARQAGQKLVNDVDDWYWGLHRSNLAYTHLGLSESREVLKQYKACIEQSDIVTCSTPFLAEQIASWGCEVALVRNAIDLDRWTPHELRAKPTVGWVGSTSHRSEDLETLRGILGPFVERHSLDFFHAGFRDGYPYAFELAGVQLLNSSWTGMSSIYDYPDQFKQIDLGIVPLNPIDFNAAKSYIKGLEYAASGVPFVAQALPEYQYLAEHGIGRVAKKPRHWVRELEALMDPEVRAAQVISDRSNLDQFNITNRWTDWLEVYESIID